MLSPQVFQHVALPNDLYAVRTKSRLRRRRERAHLLPADNTGRQCHWGKSQKETGVRVLDKLEDPTQERIYGRCTVDVISQAWVTHRCLLKRCDVTPTLQHRSTCSWDWYWITIAPVPMQLLCTKFATIQCDHCEQRRGWSPSTAAGLIRPLNLKFPALLDGFNCQASLGDVCLAHTFYHKISNSTLMACQFQSRSLWHFEIFDHFSKSCLAWLLLSFNLQCCTLQKTLLFRGMAGCQLAKWRNLNPGENSDSWCAPIDLLWKPLALAWDIVIPSGKLSCIQIKTHPVLGESPRIYC